MQGMQRCSLCRILKPIEEFNFKDKYRLQTYCKACQAIKHKAWYEKNKINRRQQIYDRRKELQSWLQNLKKELDLKCSVCGENRLPVLDFHHRDPNEKEGSISSLVNDGSSKSRVLKEIEKCDVLCSNCHRMLHYNIDESYKGST